MTIFRKIVGFVFCILFVGCSRDGDQPNINTATLDITSLEAFIEEDIQDVDRLKAYEAISYLYHKQNNLSKAVLYTKKAIALSSRLESWLPSGRNHFNLGIFLAAEGKQVEAVKNYLNAAKAFEKTGDTHGSAKACNNIGGIYLNAGDFTQAVSFYKKAIGYDRNPYKPEAVAQYHHNIGIAYLSMPTPTLQLAKQHLDTALILTTKFAVVPTQFSNSIHNYLGAVHYKGKAYKKAISSYLASLQYAQTCEEEAIGYLNLANAYTKLSMHYVADTYYAKGLSLSDYLSPANYLEAQNLWAASLLAQGFNQKATSILENVLNTPNHPGIGHILQQASTLLEVANDTAHKASPQINITAPYFSVMRKALNQEVQISRLSEEIEEQAFHKAWMVYILIIAGILIFIAGFAYYIKAKRHRELLSGIAHKKAERKAQKDEIADFLKGLNKK